jgi:hypothetical protein
MFMLYGFKIRGFLKTTGRVNGVWRKHQYKRLEKDRYCNSKYSSSPDLSSNIKYNSNSLAFLGSLILTSVIAAPLFNQPAQAETGKGDDVFKVIMTIFDVDESKGDVVAIVTANNDVAKMKLFDALGPEVVPINASEGAGHFIEYVATFPNVTVNTGDEYKACVATVKNLELVCKIGNNSAAPRPEFVDLSLSTSGSSGSEQVTTEEGDSGNDENADTTDEGSEEDNQSPGVSPLYGNVLPGNLSQAEIDAIDRMH